MYQLVDDSHYLASVDNPFELVRLNVLVDDVLKRRPEAYVGVALEVPPVPVDATGNNHLHHSPVLQVAGHPIRYLYLPPRAHRFGFQNSQRVTGHHPLHRPDGFGWNLPVMYATSICS